MKGIFAVLVPVLALFGLMYYADSMAPDDQKPYQLSGLAKAGSAGVSALRKSWPPGARAGNLHERSWLPRKPSLGAVCNITGRARSQQNQGKSEQRRSLRKFAPPVYAGVSSREKRATLLGRNQAS
jgi:hypothetical protein